MAAKDNIALRKRAQIAKANRTMFLWVAAVSVIVGFAAVGSIFLFQKLTFNERVLAEKQNTVSTLRHNNDSVSALEDEVRALESNQDLIRAKANSDDSTLQVILDALPAEANSLALGASLQNRLLAGIDGLRIETLQVDPVEGFESLGETSDETATPVEDGTESEDGETTEFTNTIQFRFTVVGDSDALRSLLNRFERSIRTIDILSLTIESRGDQQALSVEGRAFYEPSRVVELKDKVIRP